ncbi:MAG: type IV pilus modification protein PilV [Gammaproteobacteria bacterium]|nr:type IV pilus modification protein PilV [Gammaproteobacteria bacterium]
MPNANVFSATRRKHGGFSLIEVLVALFVLSIGLLGLAALQTTGLRFNHQSYQRTQAVMLSYDIIDRIRANPVALQAGDYDTVPAGPPGGYPDCIAATCTPTEMAAYDIGTWKDALIDQLGPSADAQISTVAPVRTITITWTENDLAMRMDIEADLTKTSAI